MAENKKFTRLINSDGTKQAVALDMVSFDEQTKKLTLYSSVDDTIKEETIIPASEVDATLSQSGLAADAKATGDAVKDVVKVGGTASGFTGIIVGTGEEEIELVEQKDFDAEIAKLNAKVGTPLVANAASAMVDTTKIYVYTGNENGYVNGNWYFYNGTNWESGGVYNAVAVQTDKTLTQENKAADGKAVGDELGSLKSKLTANNDAVFRPVFSENLILLAPMVDGYYYYGGRQPSASYCYFIVPVESGKTYRYNCVRFGSTASTGKINTQAYDLLFADSYTADYTGDFYVSVPKNRLADAFFCEEEDYSVVAPLKYSEPKYSSNTLAQEYGILKDVPLSQYGLSKVFPVADGTDLCFTGIQYADKYMYVDSDNKAKFFNNTAFGVYIIPATEGHYTFSVAARFVVAIDSYSNSLLYLGSDGAYSTQIDCPSGTEYLCVSFKTADFPTAKIGRGYATPTETKLSDSALKTRAEQLENKLYGKGFYKQTGTLASGEAWTTPVMNVKKNQVYSFLAKVTTFGKINIGHGSTTYDSAYLEIDGTNITHHSVFASDTTTVYPHGLTIANYIYIQLIVKTGTATVTIYSNGNSFTQADMPWGGDSNSGSYVSNNNSELSDCTFTWSCADFRKPVWMFGDSYFGMTSSERWVSYLINAGYGDNVLLNSYPGESSTPALNSLSNMLGTFGVPKTLIWCLGMNDGSDEDVNTPSTAWMTAINNVKGACDAYGIDLILATIPTVPTINHNGKNAHVKASGYRYIDFASAVGADGTGAWYTDMLSSDGVHPTATGAKALYYQAVADAPEITYS